MKKFRLNKTIINGGLFSLFSFSSQGISFVLLILLANYILPKDYGILSLYNTFVMFLGYFIDLSTKGYLSVSYFKESKESFRKDFSAVIVISISIFSILSVIFAAFGNYFYPLLDIPYTFIWIALTVVFFEVFISICQNYLRITEKIFGYGALSLGFAVLNFFLSLLLVIKYHMNWEGRAYAQFFCVIVFAIISIVYLSQNRLFTRSLSEKSRFKKIIFWGVPLIPHLAAIWLRQGGDRYIINYYYDAYEVGLFSFAINLTNIIITIGSSFNATNSVSIFQTLGSSLDTKSKLFKLKTQTKNILYIYIIATIIVILLVTLIIPTVLPKYANALPYFWILSAYGFIQCLYFLYTNYLFFYNKTKYLMFVTFSTSVLQLILSLILTRFSILYTCSIYVLVQLIILIFVYKKSRILLRNNLM